jgi:hypothetical protein
MDYFKCPPLIKILSIVSEPIVKTKVHRLKLLQVKSTMVGIAGSQSARFKVASLCGRIAGVAPGAAAFLVQTSVGKVKFKLFQQPRPFAAACTLFYSHNAQ